MIDYYSFILPFANVSFVWCCLHGYIFCCCSTDLFHLCRLLFCMYFAFVLLFLFEPACFFYYYYIFSCCPTPACVLIVCLSTGFTLAIGNNWYLTLEPIPTPQMPNFACLPIICVDCGQCAVLLPFSMYQSYSHRLVFYHFTHSIWNKYDEQNICISTFRRSWKRCPFLDRSMLFSPLRLRQQQF